MLKKSQYNSLKIYRILNKNSRLNKLHLQKQVQNADYKNLDRLLGPCPKSWDFSL
jgi:type VI protein secretion system component VasK